MTTTRTIPATQNEAWGFWGTMSEQASDAWPLAMLSISDATDMPLETVRIFLDSRLGRHFADDVLNGLAQEQTLPQAIAAATLRWMKWRIDRTTSKSYGIPCGLPYLTGFVIHCDVIDNTVAA